MQFLDLAALGPRMRKPLHELQRDFQRALNEHVEVYPDGMRMIMWHPWGGGYNPPEVRAEQRAAWDAAIEGAKAQHGPLGPKNREQWLDIMRGALVLVQKLAPVVDKRLPERK